MSMKVHLGRYSGGWGVLFNYSASLNDDTLTPFIRGGYANDGGTLLERSVSMLGLATIPWVVVTNSVWRPTGADPTRIVLGRRA